MVLFKVMLVFVLLGLTHAAIAEISPEDKAIMEKIVAAHTQARGKIHSLKCTRADAVDFQPFEGWPVTHSDVTQEDFEKGRWRTVITHVNQRLVNGTNQESVSRAIIDDSLFVKDSNVTQVSIYFHASLDDLPKKEREESGVGLGSCILNYGFGNGYYLLSDSYAKTPPEKVRWKVTEGKNERGERIYSLRAFRLDTKDRATPLSEWTIDSSRGFLATHVVEWGGDGRISRDLKVTPSLVAVPGAEAIWLATSIDDTRPAPPRADGSAGPPSVHLVQKYSSIEINPDLDDSIFTLAFLHLKDGTLVENYDPDGKRTTLVMLDDQAMPREIAAEIRRARRRGF